MDKGFGRVMQYFLKRWERPKRKRRRKDIIFLEKTRTFCNKKMPLVFPEVFCFVEEETKEGSLAPKSKRPHRIRVPTLPKKTRKRYVDGEKPFPISERKNFLSSQKEGICVSPSSVGRIIKRKPSFCPKKICGKTKEENPKGTKTLDYEIKNAGDLIALDTVVLKKRKKKYIITAIDLFSRIALARSYSRPTSKNAADLLRRMHIALSVPMKAVNTDNGGEFLLHFERLAKKKIKHFFTFREPQR